MSTTQAIATVMVALLALAGGAAAASVVNAIARRRVTGAEADSIVVETADRLMGRQQEQIDRGDKERVRMEAEISALRTEVAQLREDIADERTRCDAQLDTLRSQLIDLALRVDPTIQVDPNTQGDPQ